MRIIVDACLRREIVDFLESQGYVCDYINDIDPAMSDEAVKRLGYRNDAIIITADKEDFNDYDLALLVDADESIYRIRGMLKALSKGRR